LGKKRDGGGRASALWILSRKQKVPKNPLDRVEGEGIKKNRALGGKEKLRTTLGHTVSP